MAEKDLLTRYLIFETDAAATVFTRIGEQLARGAEEAIRKHFGSPPTDREGYVVAVSENNFKLRKAKATVKTSIAEVDLPDLGELVEEPPLAGTDAATTPEPVAAEAAEEKQEALV